MLYFYISLKALRNGYSSSSVPHQNICCSRLVSNLIQRTDDVPGKFSLKNTVINVVAGLGLISFITMFCDFILLNYVSERKVVRSVPQFGQKLTTLVFAKTDQRFSSIFTSLCFQIKQKKFDVLDKQVGLEVQHYIFKIFVLT